MTTTFLSAPDIQARQVLRWRLEKPGIAEKLWDTLSGANTEIFDCLEEMNGQYRVRKVTLLSRVLCDYVT
jgi:hypothetical protein